MNLFVKLENESFPSWGIWTTIIWGLFIGFVIILINVFAIAAYMFIKFDLASQPDIPDIIQKIIHNGSVLTLSSLVSSIICVILIFGIIKLKKRSNIKKYLAFNKVDYKRVGLWFIILSLFIIISDFLTHFFGRPIVPEVMVNIYSSTKYKWVFWIAIVIACPVFEELLFRGFLMKGFSLSFLRPIGAIIITSIMWSLLHIQYDIYGILTIFFIGMFLGIVRFKTNSIFLTIGLHSFMNLVATIETLIILSSRAL